MTTSTAAHAQCGTSEADDSQLGTVAPDADQAAIEHFAAKLRFETDPSDVAAARAGGQQIIVVDVRSRAAWDQGHVPGAVHLPAADIPARLDVLPAPQEQPDLVVYCWGPGCNGSTKAALALSQVGYRCVREMIGGFEYWAREGLAIETTRGRTRRPVDKLSAPVPVLPPSLQRLLDLQHNSRLRSSRHRAEHRTDVITLERSEAPCRQ